MFGKGVALGGGGFVPLLGWARIGNEYVSDGCQGRRAAAHGLPNTAEPNCAQGKDIRKPIHHADPDITHEASGKGEQKHEFATNAV